MNRITPQTLLPEGTEIQVKGKRGIVFKSEWSKDQFGDWICLHTVKLNEIARNVLSKSGKMVCKWEAIEAETYPCNYSFIYTIK